MSDLWMVWDRLNNAGPVRWFLTRDLAMAAVDQAHSEWEENRSRGYTRPFILRVYRVPVEDVTDAFLGPSDVESDVTPGPEHLSEPPDSDSVSVK